MTSRSEIDEKDNEDDEEDDVDDEDDEKGRRCVERVVETTKKAGGRERGGVVLDDIILRPTLEEDNDNDDNDDNGAAGRTKAHPDGCSVLPMIRTSQSIVGNWLVGNFLQQPTIAVFVFRSCRGCFCWGCC